MKRLFIYRPNGNVISTNAGDKLLMAIRKGPRGIVSIIDGMGPIIIWDTDNADAHVGDAEEVLIQRTIDVLNS